MTDDASTDGPDERDPGGSDAYVHEPDGSTTGDPGPNDREFGRRGWILVGVIVLAFVVAPLLIYLRPPALPFKFAYLVLPLVPAVLLGATAVWAAQRNA
ncbi:hypothetical protein [Halomicrococcus sp. NG-SE-24]|uniref:hypothetical protein n=1 Tax=Halomicrococcus sp. NG-SE-24 TaxID=3436928 RepID=UPI003D990217